MSSEVLDPEVEEILREIAKDPRSSLLRVERPSHPVGFDYEPVSMNQAGLTVAERELLRVHRAEVAYLLRQRWVRGAMALESPRILVDFRRSVDQENGHLMPQSEWMDRIRFAADDHLPLETGVDLLESCIRDAGEPTSVQSLYHIAETSMRLEPSESAKLYLCWCLLHDSQPRSALRMLRSVLGANETTVSSCLEMKGTAFSDLKRNEDARRAFAQASNQTNPTPLSLLGYLRTSVRTVHRQSLAHVCELIDTAVPTDSRAFNKQVDCERQRVRAGTLVIPSEGRALMLSIQEKLGDVSRKATHALLLV